MKKMKLISFALKSPLPGRGGWGNGYVAIPKGHPCYGMDYDAIHDNFSINVHYGLTWARLQDDGGLSDAPEEVRGMWVVGFDTLHLGDDMNRWPDEESILDEADRLKEQLEKIK